MRCPSETKPGQFTNRFTRRSSVSHARAFGAVLLAAVGVLASCASPREAGAPAPSTVSRSTSGNTPPADQAAPAPYIDEIYLQDYYAPPPDWLPARAIRDFNPGVRLPDITWVRYDGAYQMGLRIRQIDPALIRQQIDAKLIDPALNPRALEADPRTAADPINRRIAVTNLGVPAGEFVSFSFKMKGPPGAVINFEGKGLRGRVDTHTDLDPQTPGVDGFRGYKIALKNVDPSATLDSIAITADESGAELLFIDMMFERRRPVPLVVDAMGPRRWIVEKTGEPITDVYNFVNGGGLGGGGEVDAKAIPLRGWAKADGAMGKPIGGCTIETVQEKIDGQSVEALRVTVTKPPEGTAPAYIRVPFPINADLYNTVTFLAKVETPEGVFVQGDARPAVWGYDQNQFNRFWDSFGVALDAQADFDAATWSAMMVPRTMLNQQWDRSAKAPPGWKAFVWDIRNDTHTGNKDFTHDKVSHFSLTYDNAQKPWKEGQKVVITIVNPRVVKGLMHAGGDMKRYRAWQQSAARPRRDEADFSQHLRPGSLNSEGMLKKPLRFIENHVCTGEIVVGDQPAGIKEARSTAVQELVTALRELYLKSPDGKLGEIPVLEQPSGKDNVKIFLGRHKTMDPRVIADDVKRLDGTPGCAIRVKGKHVYIFGGQFRGYREDKGLLNGVYTFVENNTDLIWPGPTTPEAVFTPDPKGNFDIVWGDYANLPRAEFWGMLGGGPKWVSRERGNLTGVWMSPETLQFATGRIQSWNHWFGWGAGKEANEKWGLINGQRVQPGCYTAHPCLIRCLEDGKREFGGKILEPFGYYSGPGPTFGLHNYDAEAFGLQIEDNWNVCGCELCTTPMRLPNGKLIQPGETDFRSNQFYAYISAMNLAQRVAGNYAMQVNALVYFFCVPVPRVPVTRNLNPHFCPYVRKETKQPLFAPINDEWWRMVSRWAQVNANVQLRDYYIGVNYRPMAEVWKADFNALTGLGVRQFCGEAATASPASLLEQWCMMRLFWEPRQDVERLRDYFCARTYREAAPAMARFHARLRLLQQQEKRAVEFEEQRETAFLALKTPADHGDGTLADDLERLLQQARGEVRHPQAREHVEAAWKAWTEYITPVREKLRGGAR